MNFTEAMWLFLSLQYPPALLAVIAFLPVFQWISNSGKLRKLVPYATYCCSTKPEGSTLCPKGFGIVSSDLTKYMGHLISWDQDGLCSLLLNSMHFFLPYRFSNVG